MSIDVEHFRERLKQRESELVAALGRSGDEKRDASGDGVEDTIDLATSRQEKDLASEEGDRDFEQLTEVRDALGRIAAGTYGRCSVCGREIEKARLEAVPWTKYCIEDARKLDSTMPPPTL